MEGVRMRMGSDAGSEGLGLRLGGGGEEDEDGEEEEDDEERMRKLERRHGMLGNVEELLRENDESLDSYYSSCFSFSSFLLFPPL